MYHERLEQLLLLLLAVCLMCQQHATIATVSQGQRLEHKTLSDINILLKSNTKY